MIKPTMIDKLKACPFCGGQPRHLERNPGFYSERVICDACYFHLPPDKWNHRAEIKDTL